MMRTYIASIVIILTIGIASASQADSKAHTDDVLRLVTHPCVDSSVGSVPARHQVPPTAQLFTFLERELNKTIHEAMDTSESLKHWRALFGGQTYAKCLAHVKILQIPKPQHSSLSEIENSRLHVYLQLANYAHFLMKQETAGYNQNTEGSRLLKPGLRIQISKTMCKLRELLQRNDEELTVLTTQDINGHLLPLKTMNMSSSIKRAICAVAIELMFDTIKQVKVFQQTGSVQLPVNI